MARKTTSKTFRVSMEEKEIIRAKAKKAGMNESDLLRSLVLGYRPKEKPDDRFYDMMFQMRSIANSLNQIAKKAHMKGFIDKPYYMREAEKWNRFMIEVKKEYLLPKKE